MASAPTIFSEAHATYQFGAGVYDPMGSLVIDASVKALVAVAGGSAGYDNVGGFRAGGRAFTLLAGVATGWGGEVHILTNLAGLVSPVALTQAHYGIGAVSVFALTHEGPIVVTDSEFVADATGKVYALDTQGLPAIGFGAGGSQGAGGMGVGGDTVITNSRTTGNAMGYTFRDPTGNTVTTTGRGASAAAAFIGLGDEVATPGPITGFGSLPTPYADDSIRAVVPPPIPGLGDLPAPLTAPRVAVLVTGTPIPAVGDMPNPVVAVGIGVLLTPIPARAGMPVPLIRRDTNSRTINLIGGGISTPERLDDSLSAGFAIPFVGRSAPGNVPGKPVWKDLTPLLTPSGSSNLDDLLDVDVPAPEDGQVVTWDESTGTWIATDAATGGGVSDHGVLTGLLDDDHTQYELGYVQAGTPPTPPPHPAAIWIDTDEAPPSGGGSGAGVELAYAELTSSVTVSSTSGASPNDVIAAPAVVFDGSTRVCIEFYCAEVYAPSSAAGPNFALWDDTTRLGTMGIRFSGGSTDTRIPVLLRRFLTPTAGSHTYKIRASKSGGTDPTIDAGAGGAGQLMPMYIRVTKA